MLGLGLPFAVIASTTLKRGALMSALCCACALVGFFLARLLGRHVSDTLRVLLVSLGAVCAVGGIVQSGVFSRVLIDGLGAYVPLAAANMILVSIAVDRQEQPFSAALRGVCFSCIGFTLAMCLLSVIRELLSLHTIWDRPVQFSAVPISGAALPCFGFILLGFFAAFGRTLGRAHLRILIRRTLRAKREEKEEGIG